MNREMAKIVYAVLRVFLDAYNRGTGNALHAKEITEQVCKQLQRRKEKEKKNTHGYVVTALKALKNKQVVFEAVDDWGNDKLHTAKPVEGRKIFALTADVVDFLTRGDLMPGYSTGSQRVLNAVLTEFDVIAPATGAAPIVVPSALVETVSTIQNKAAFAAESQGAMTPMSTMSTVTDNNIQRLVAEIRNASRVGGNTPAQLLGALNAAAAHSIERAVSFSALEFNCNVGAKVRQILIDRGLLAHREEREVNYKHRPHTPQLLGMYLTPLGLQVAEAGGFVDDRKPNEKYHRPSQSKYGRMVRTPALSQPLPASPAENGGDLAALRAEIAALRAAMTGFAPPPHVETASPRVTPPPVKTIGRYQTIGAIVTATVNAIVSRIEALQTENGSTALNVDAAGLAMVEVDHVVAGLKCYLYSCARGEREFDANFLRDYAAQVELDAEQLDAARRLPVLGTIADVGTARVLRGSKAIKRAVWAQ
jgi:hypothetical protein